MRDVVSAQAGARTGQPPALEEEELAQGARARSPQAWSIIYERHYRQIYLYALARLHDQAAAEDVAATVFLEALKSIGSYSYRGKPLLAWLYRIARNVVADHLRQQGGRNVGPGKAARPRLIRLLRRWSQGEEEREPAAPQADPLGGVEGLDLRRALAGLTGDQREVIALHYFAGFTLREVAGLLRKTERAVYSLQARALASLRRQLQ